MTWVVDRSVAVEWFVAEPDHRNARRIRLMADHRLVNQVHASPLGRLGCHVAAV